MVGGGLGAVEAAVEAAVAGVGGGVAGEVAPFARSGGVRSRCSTWCMAFSYREGPGIVPGMVEASRR